MGLLPNSVYCSLVLGTVEEVVFGVQKQAFAIFKDLKGIEFP
jgi:hypothetical protein